MQLLQLSEDLARWGAYPTRRDTTDEDRGLTARPSGAGEAQRCLGSSWSLGLTIQMVLDRVWAHTPSSPSRAIQWCRQCRGVCPEAGGPLDTPGVWQGSQGKRDPCPLRPLPACPAGSREAGLTSAGVECGRQPPPGSSSSRIWTQPSGAELQEASSPSLVSLSSFSRTQNFKEFSNNRQQSTSNPDSVYLKFPTSLFFRMSSHTLSLAFFAYPFIYL